MEMTSRLLRPRFCIRYVHIFLTFSIFSVFLICLHQFRPKGSEFGVPELKFFSGWRGNANFMRGGSNSVSEDSTTGVLPIVFSHVTRKEEKVCTGDSISTLEGIVELPVGRARHDNRRLLKISDFLRIGMEWENLVRHYDVCLSTQTSVERIYWIPQVLENWKGPLSLAVHITSEEEWIILNLFMQYLERCHSTFRDQVSLHMAVPSSIGPFCFDPKMTKNLSAHFEHDKLHNQCDDARGYMNYLLKTFPVTNKQKLALKEVYPQNHMRNIARKACGTEWTYSTDVDIIPCKGMADSLQTFYESMQTDPLSCKKCAFVIPTFELDEKKPFPKSKGEIVHYYNARVARQFHGKIFPIGHSATNFFQWVNTNLEEGPVKISHPVIASQTYLYEPFYISSDLIPPYDERFLGYGFTRNSQFQEALYAGWNFTVLTPIYSIYWGLQSPHTLLSPKKRGTGRNVRSDQTRSNKKLFEKILKEMKLKKHEGLF